MCSLRIIILVISVTPIFCHYAKESDICMLIACKIPSTWNSGGITCNCYQQQQTDLAYIVCPKLSAEPFTVHFYHQQFLPQKIIIDGLNKHIPFRFLSNIVQCGWLIDNLAVVNFCPVNWNTSRKVNTSELITKEYKYMTVLNLTNNCIDSISEDLSEQLIGLKELDLSFNRLTQLPVFKHQLREMNKLNASNNLIAGISRQNFQNSMGLEILNISNNKLSLLNDDLLNDLQDLEVLDLSHNFISKLPHLTEKNKRLKRLYLNNNNLTTLPQHYFKNSEKLVHLDLSTNKINFTSSRGFVGLRKLETVYLNNMGLSELHKFFFWNLLSIKIISLTHNNLTAIPSLIVYNDYVLLDLRFNRITTLPLPPTMVVAGPRYFSLDISHNCIQLIRPIQRRPYDFFRHFRNNKFDNYIHRCSVRCSFCCLKVLHPRMFEALNDRLDFSHNNITELNLSGLKNLPNDTRVISLNLSHNQITKLTNGNYEVWSKISVLDISHNHLTSLENLTVTPNLDKLYLNNNSISDFSNVIQNLLSSNVVEVTLAGNPWLCNCEIKNLVVKSRIFTDKHLMTCVNDGLQYNFTDIDRLCYTEKRDSTLLWLLMPITIIVIVISALVTFYYKFKAEILYFMFSRGLCLRFVCERDIDTDKVYDAFVSYSYEDEDWVANFLVPDLESGTPEYKLCIHNRDWLGGEYIPDQIVKSVESSKRTIIVLTENFVKSVWSRMEFDVAYRQATEDKMPRLIVVLPNEVPDLSEATDEFKTFVSLTTYIQANKPHFWRKLRASMPRTRNHLLEDKRRRLKKNQKNLLI